MKNLLRQIFLSKSGSDTPPESSSVPQDQIQKGQNFFDIFHTKFDWQKDKKKVLIGVTIIFFVIIFLKFLWDQVAVKLLSSPFFSGRFLGLLVFLAILIGVAYRIKRTWHIELFNFFKKKAPVVQYHFDRHYTRINEHSANWIERFHEASNRERFLMTWKFVVALLVIVVVIKNWALFIPPKIATSYPGRESSEAPLDSRIEIIFDQPMLKFSVENSFAITPATGGKMSWEGDQKLVFTPDKKLERGRRYNVSFRGIVLSKFFVPLISNGNIVFETIGNPKVILASPQAEALEDYAPVTVIFDRPIIALTTATNSAIRSLSAFEISPKIEGEGRWLGTTAYQFRPSQPFKRASTYTVSVPAGLKSQDGGVLQQAYSWSFSSERPRVEQISPARDYDYASPTASISALFTQEVDPASVQDKFVLYDKNSKKVEGRISVNGRRVGFWPLKPLVREAGYKAVINAGVKSVEGPNGMESAYWWDFRVTALPAVLTSSPSNGDKDVVEQHTMSVTFKTPMDQASFKDNVTIEPKPERAPSLYFSSYNYLHSLSIGTYLGRSTNYKITVGENAKDQYGVPLGKSFTFSFTTSSYKPSITIYPFGTYFGAFNQDVVPRIVAQTINSNKVTYTLYRLKREDLLELYRRRYESVCYDNDCRNWRNYDTSKLEKVRVWSETYESDFNMPVHVVTKVSTQSGGKIPSGFYFLDVRIPQGEYDNMVMIVSKSTLTVKKSNKQIFAWGVNQSSNDVVSSMKMELTDSSGNILSSGATNNDGVFMKDVNLYKRDNLFVFGQKGDDQVVASSAWSQGINAYDFGIPYYYNYNESADYYSQDRYKMHLQLDRPIFRPGHKVYFKGVIRKDNDGAYESIPAGEMITVSITDAQQRSIYTQELPLTSYGSFSGSYVLSKDANLGYYQVDSTFRGNSYKQSFQVEEYRRPEFSVSVTPSKDTYVTGEEAIININSSYYFGAPVANAQLSWTMQSYDYSFSWDKDWRFEFGDPDTYWSRWWGYSSGSDPWDERVTYGKGVTNGRGDFEFRRLLDLSKQKMGQSMTVEASVNDVSNQSISSSKSFTVHKARLYAGVRPLSYSNQSGKEAKVSLVVVDLNGKEVGNTVVNVEFYKRTWETVREKNPDDGLFYYTSKASDTQVGSASVTTDSLGYSNASFIPSEGGTYKVIARVRDGEGRENVSGSYLWVSGYGFSAMRENHDRIVLVSDKRDYFVGDNMSIFVASPYATDSAKTLLTVERGSVLDYKVVETSELSNNFEIGIPPKYTPNVFVGAVLVRGGNEVKKPAEFKIGYTEVKVTDKKQQIDVRITTDKKRYKPKETMRATIETKDLLGHGVSSELAVGLVDKAVWDLGVALPDIYKTFYQPRSLEVATSQLLTISIDRINANTNLGSKGGSGGGCFTGDTQILMKGGLTKQIEDIKTGDFVLTRKGENIQELVAAKVLKTFKHTVDEYLIINGELRVTPIHRMYVNNAWMVASQIQNGDLLIDKDNRLVRVFSIERVRGKFQVYNLEIEKYRTFFAGGVYVHNQKGDGMDTARSNFPETAYWNPHLKTDSNGKANIEIKLPDNLTTWRLAAIANTSQAAFGSKVSEVVVSRDVLIRPFLPRFLSVGDEAKLGAIVVNTSGEEQLIRTKITTEGIDVKETNVKEQVLVDGAQAKLTWATVARNGTLGKIKLSVEGSDGAVKDAVEVSLPIKSYSVPEVVATSGEAKDTAAEKITLPKEIDATQGQGSITLSPSMGSSSINGLPYLFNYPYYCTEQITSRVMPAVFVNRILINAKIEGKGLLKSESLGSIIRDGIQRLNNQQHSDGGWGWWIEYASDPYITSYVYFALSEARKDGFIVADQTLSRAKSFLEHQLARRDSEVGLSTRAYILYVLKENPGLSSYAANVFDRRFELSLESRANLAVAMWSIPGMSDRAKRLHNEIVGLAKKTSTTTHWEEPRRNYYFMGGNTTTTASVLEMLTIFDKKNPLISEVVRYLMSIRRDEHWATTRDTASVIQAIATQLLTKGEQNLDESYRLELNGKILKEGRFTKDDLFKLEEHAISISKFAIGGTSSLRFTKSGTGSLYYNINLKYYLPFSEIKALEQGMMVIREFVDSNGKVLPSHTIDENSEVWVRLIVVAPEERHYVVIEDILPAGLESVNESLKNVSTLSKKQPNLKEKGNEFLYFQHKEYHDDRTTLFADFLPPGVYEVAYRVRATTPGRYHHPPASAYQMYIPDVSGHSDGGWLEVRPSN